MTARVHPPVTPEQGRENSRKGGRLAQSPRGLARRLVRKFPELTEEEQAEILLTLKDITKHPPPRRPMHPANAGPRLGLGRASRVALGLPW